MTEICFLFPRKNIKGVSGGTAPLGVLYLATFLQSKGINCFVYDYFFGSTAGLLKKIKKEKVKKIGFSITSPNARIAFKLIETVKRHFPDMLVICGGPHVTALPDETISHKDVDIIVLGEGEEVFYNLIKSYPHINEIQGIWYKKKGKVVKNESAQPIKNLDSLPFPDRNLVKINKYIKKTNAISLITSRGCPYNCIFCQPTQRRIFGAKVRRRSIDNVIAEMFELKKKYPGDWSYYFQDDTFTFDKNWLEKFCLRLAKKDCHFKWQCHSRVNLIDYQKIKLMKKAGCEAIYFGVESGSQKILNFMRKNITVKETKRAFNLVHKNNIIAHAFIMIGTPTETKQDLEETRQLIDDIHPDALQISITTPMIGSDLHTYCQEKGISNITCYDDYEYCLNKYPIHLENFTIEDLEIYRRKIYNTFLKARRKNLKKYLYLFLHTDNKILKVRKVIAPYLVKMV